MDELLTKCYNDIHVAYLHCCLAFMHKPMIYSMRKPCLLLIVVWRQLIVFLAPSHNPCKFRFDKNKISFHCTYRARSPRYVHAFWWSYPSLNFNYFFIPKFWILDTCFLLHFLHFVPRVWIIDFVPNSYYLLFVLQYKNPL